MKPYSDITIDERIAAKRERCVGRAVQIIQWSDDEQRSVVVASGTIEDVTRIDAPDMQEWLDNSDGKIYGYIVRLSTGEQQTYRVSGLHWM